MNKQEIVATLRQALKTVIAERRNALDNPKVLAARNAVKRFQSERMAKTHADLLEASDTRRAAQFFLEDLYGARDLTGRDADVERIIPTMERMLPEAALQTIMEAYLLDALSERLDAAMADVLGENFTEAEYLNAYRQVGGREDRERQIAHINSVGEALSELVRIPFIRATLTVMRGPARLAGLENLHQFLQTGFSAFKAIRRPELFLSTVLKREQSILENSFAGVERPFAQLPI